LADGPGCTGCRAHQHRHRTFAVEGARIVDSRMLGLFLVFAPLSLMSFGGGQAIIADMQHQTVDVQHWMSGRDFVDLFAISRAAPGPSTLIAALIGWNVAGLGGAIVAA